MLERKQTTKLSPINVGGIWGSRLSSSLNRWLLCVENDVLLDCFRRRPGAQAFVGEHVGKYLDCALLDNYILESTELKRKIKDILYELIACQEEDGYLGTYLPETRYVRYPEVENCGWDPWVAKYILISIWRYCQEQKDEQLINCGKRLLKWLSSVYGENGEYNLNRSDEHAGLASGSILEAIMLWYEMTGEQYMLDLARRIVTYYWSEEAPFTPHLIKHMTEHPYGLKTTGRGKAYEMMSCFVGLIEYARITGEIQYLNKVIEARDGIARNLKTVNGCMSEREWFPQDGNISEMADLENCVAFTWIQLNTRLFEMTGDIKCIDYVEESAWNHIVQALCPDGSTWIYYTTFYGPKDYTYWSQLPSSPQFRQMMGIMGFHPVYDEDQISSEYKCSAPITCCHTNGQRALGLVPQYVCTVSHENEICLNLLMDIHKTLDLNGCKANVTVKTDFPRNGDAIVTVNAPMDVDMLIRVPGWAVDASIDRKNVQAGSYVRVHLVEGDNQILVHFGMELRLISPGHVNRGKFCLIYGPLLMAVDSLPAGWDFEEISISLCKKNPVDALELTMENGWPLVTAKAYRFDSNIGAANWHDLPSSLESAKVVFRPFLFCGLGDNLAASELYEGDYITYDVRIPLTQYRVMFPCFFEQGK